MGNRTGGGSFGALVAGVAVVLLSAVVLGGCSFLSGTSKTLSSLRHAGYHNVGIHIESGSGLPPDGLVDISYSAGPTGNSEADAYNAARITWNTLRYRFGALTVTTVSGGCAGPFCVSHQNEVGGETYTQLLVQFGPRPAALDKTPASKAVHFPIWIPAVVGVLVVAAVAAIIFAIVRKRRRPGLSNSWVPPNPPGGSGASAPGQWSPPRGQWNPPAPPPTQPPD